MKTKEVIRQLQEADPSGEEEVCIGNHDIYRIFPEDAYYDGSLQIIEKDKNGHIIGGTIRRSGMKVQMIEHTLEDVVLELMLDHYDTHGNLDYEAPIKVIGDTFNSYNDTIKYWHDEAKSIIRKVREGKEDE